MPGTYSQLLIHCVFATKHRKESLTAAFADRVYGYIGGIVRAESASLLCIGGMPDHVHMLIRWRTDVAVADLVRQIKSRSSRWIHETFVELGTFAWQEGYSAFTVSPSQEAVVRRYILNQAQHHLKEDFKTELTRLLKAHGITFDPQHLVD